MKNLLELFQIIRKGNPDKIELLNKTLLSDKSDTKFAQLYEGLLSGKIKNDLEAAQLIYQSSTTDVKYRQLKSRFRKRLLNTLLLLEQLPAEPDKSKQDDYIYAQKQWALILIAHRHNAATAADSMARNLLNFCEKREFHQVAFDAAHFLWKQAINQKDTKKANRYYQVRKKHLAFYQARMEAEEVFLRHQLSFYSQNQTSPNIAQDNARLIQLADQHPSANIYFYMFCLNVLNHRSTGNYQAMTQICRQARQQLQQFPHWPQAHQMLIFYIHEMLALWALKDINAATYLAEQALPKLEKDSKLWLDFMELYLLTALYAKDLTRAKAIHKKINEQLLSIELNAIQKEKWALYEAYLCFIDPDREPNDELWYKINYAHSIYLYHPDKHAKKQWGLILHLLQITRLKNNDPFFLKNKLSNNDKSNSTKRRNLFLKLLERLYIAQSKGGKLRLVEKYYKQLRSTSPVYCTQLEHLEIIPLQDLWEMLLERFDIHSW